MLIVSSRQNFWSANHISTLVNDKIRTVRLMNTSLEDAGSDVSPAQFKAAVRGKKVLFLVHGYNNERYEPLRAYAMIQDLHAQHTNYYDVLVGYTWPGGDDRTDYFAAKDRAGAVARRLRSTLEVLLTECSELGIMSHSMGCRVSYLALNDLQRDAFPRAAKLVTWNMASAIDNESVEQDERYHRATLFADGVHIFHSRRDGTLRFAYRAAEWDRALGDSGPEDLARTEAHLSVVNCKRVIGGHGDYKRTPEIFRYLETATAGGASRMSSL